VRTPKENTLEELIKRQNKELEEMMAREVHAFFVSWSSKKRQIFSLFTTNHLTMLNPKSLAADGNTSSMGTVSESPIFNIKQQKI